MRTLDPNDFVYEDEASSSLAAAPSTVSSAEPKTVSDFTFEEEPSTFSDALTGAEQGLTFGFSDEAIAAAKAAGAVVSGKKGQRGISDIYDEYVALERDKIRRAKEASPWAFTAGEVAGSLPLAFLTGGAGAVSSLGRAVKTGAAIGGLTGIGASEKSLTEDPIGLVGEGLKGAAGGAATAGALGLAGLGAKKALNAVGKTSLFQQLKVAKELPSLADTSLARSKTAATEIVTDIENALSRQGQKINSALENAGKAGTKIALEEGDDALKSAAMGLESELVNNPNLLGSEGREAGLLKKLIGTKSDPATGAISEIAELSPKDANVLRRAARDAFNQLTKIQSPDVATRTQMQKLRSLDLALKEKLENKVTGFKLENDAFEEFSSAIPETFLSKGTEKALELEGGKAVRTGIASYSQKDPKELINAVESFINSIKSGGASNKKYVEAFEKLKQRIDDFGPERLKALGMDKDALIQKIEKESHIARIYKDVHGELPGEGIERRLGAWASAGGWASRGAHHLGQAQRFVSKTAEKMHLPDLSKRVFAIPKDALETAVAGPLKKSGSPVAARYGEMLSDAISKSTPGNTATNAVLFMILQNAAARQALSGE